MKVPLIEEKTPVSKVEVAHRGSDFGRCLLCEHSFEHFATVCHIQQPFDYFRICFASCSNCICVVGTN